MIDVEIALRTLQTGAFGFFTGLRLMLSSLSTAFLTVEVAFQMPLKF